MTAHIHYKKSILNKKLSNYIFFVDEEFDTVRLKNQLSSGEYSFIRDILKTKDLKKEILAIDISSKRKIILVSLKKNQKNSDLENLGAKFYDLFKDAKQNIYNLNSNTISTKYKNLVGNFLHGLKLKSYTFEKYKTG